MRVLNSANCHFNWQTSLLISLYLPIISSPNIPCCSIIALTATPAWWMNFKLHHGTVGSLQQDTETSSSSYELMLPVAPNLTSQWRSYFQLRSLWLTPTRTCTMLIKCLHRRTVPNVPLGMPSLPYRSAVFFVRVWSSYLLLILFYCPKR